MTDRSESGRQSTYRIRVQGQLDQRWSEWFGGVTVAAQDNGETVLTAPVPDQAALHGLLGRIRDLGLPLLSLSRVEGEESLPPGA
jgi:hypothetical protein